MATIYRAALRTCLREEHRALLMLVAILLMGGVAVQGQVASTDKPKVRAITAFVHLDRQNYKLQVTEALKMLEVAKSRFEAQGYEVQTIRVSTQPFTDYTMGMKPSEIESFFRELDAWAVEAKVNLSIGPMGIAPADWESQASLLSELLASTKMLNSSIVVARDEIVDWKAIRAAARIMKSLQNTGQSQGNFRFAAIANVPQLTPFFPAAYHEGKGRQFTIGLQSANLVQSAFRGTEDRVAAIQALSTLLNTHARAVEKIGVGIAKKTGWEYSGIDLSPAPLADTSIGAAVEDLSKKPIGSAGTLSAAAEITAALKAAPVKHAGYSGLMLPVLEDSRLAQRWSEGRLSLDSLLAYSAVCGTGLDVVPLPGDVTEAQLERIIGDVASLSAKWRKPLSARLLPIAGKKAGDRTQFDSPYLMNATIQTLP